MISFHHFLTWNDTFAQAGSFVLAQRFPDIYNLLEFWTVENTFCWIHWSWFLLKQLTVMCKGALVSKSAPSFSIVPVFNRKFLEKFRKFWWDHDFISYQQIFLPFISTMSSNFGANLTCFSRDLFLASSASLKGLANTEVPADTSVEDRNGLINVEHTLFCWLDDSVDWSAESFPSLYGDKMRYNYFAL